MRTDLVLPVGALAFLPDTFAHSPIELFVEAAPVLLAILPSASVRAAVCPDVRSLAMLLIVHIITLVFTPVAPGISSPAMHVIV